jgi:hypothetical protein
MRMEDHDPDNGRTINRGNAGAELDGIFESGTEEPTKLEHTKGYDFDGGDSMVISDSYSIDTGKITMFVLWSGVDFSNSFVFDWEDLAGNLAGAIGTSENGEARFFCGAPGGPSTAIAFIPTVKRFSSLIGVHDGTDTIAYVNGLFAAKASSPLPPVASSDPIRLGARVNESAYYTGKIYSVGFGDEALTPVQVHRLHRDLVEGFHRI